MHTDAWCPYCDKLRRRDSSGRLLRTCGDEACHRMAIGDALHAKDANAIRWPRLSGDIDFRNGFDSQNLTFAADRARLRT